MSDWWDNMTGVGNLPDSVSPDIDWTDPSVWDWSKLGPDDRPVTIDTSDQPVPPASLPGGVEAKDQEYRTSPASGDTSFSRFIKDLMGAGGAQKLLGQGLNFATSKAGLAGLMALLSYLDRQKGIERGGGTTQAYAGPSQPLTRKMVQGKYGPIATYAAQGGLMQAYAQGGKVQMEDGGFVMTKKAVDGAGGPRGIQSLVPGARPIRGPGTGTSDSIPATIQGRNGVTPAKVSNGEAYIPPGHDTEALYALMHQLERKA